MIAFFDASALIYLIEAKPPFAAKARAVLADLAKSTQRLDAAVSRLTWLECRVGPMRANDAILLSAYDAFFARTDLIWVELGREVVELAAAIRAREGLRTPDALQAASCLQLGPEHRFLTGDRAFRRVNRLNVELLA